MKTSYKGLDNQAPMTRDQFIEWCGESKLRHIRIIADYADQKKLHFSTKGQWNAFLKRNMRAARFLAPYSDDQIEKAFKSLKRMLSQRDFKWTLETLNKFLDE